MSHLLWKYYLQDDLEAFQQLLSSASFSAANAKSTYSTNNPSAIASSPGRGLATSPVAKSKLKGRQPAGIVLTRADLNWRDHYGRTLLHHMATSNDPRSTEFALTLLTAPLLDLYAQDTENGWTSLHRALYYGNIAIARALMSKDIQDAVETIGTSHAGGLIKIKDKDGNSPFDVYNDTIGFRMLDYGRSPSAISAGDGSVDNLSEDSDEAMNESQHLAMNLNGIEGDEIYTFGTNKNYNLGFVDGDDRQFPEKPTILRPASLLKKYHKEHMAKLTENTLRRMQNSKAPEVAIVPNVVRAKPIHILDVQLAKLHSAILTTDTESNLYVCGFGPGYRLGTGDEQTRFNFTSVTGGGLGTKRVTSVALGLNHTIAVTSEGRTYSWGSNGFGQLGYVLAKESHKEEDRVQPCPRQIFGSLKQEFVIGCAASRTHSVVHTRISLFTFGKNEGQLGLVDADARSLEIQSTPRQVALSRFSSPIVMVSAIEKATICLLENHDVLVFANYGYSKLQLPLDGFATTFARRSFFGARPAGHSNHVVKICSGGNTICALTSEGEVLTVAVKSELSPNAISTTNPSKIRDSVSSTQKLWSIRKSSMAARDVDVGQDGSVIICTTGGSVWRREKRAKIKDTQSGHVKDYKFSRVPGLTRIVAVRSNAFGAFAAVRKDCDVLKTQLAIEPRRLWKDVFTLLPLRGFVKPEHHNQDIGEPTPWRTRPVPYDPVIIRTAIIRSTDLEKDLAIAMENLGSFDDSTYDLKVGTTLSDTRIPVHSFLLAARSPVIRQGLEVFAQEYFYSIPDVLMMEYDTSGHPIVIFQGLDVLSLLALVFYMYTDGIIDVWYMARHAPSLAYASRQARAELMKLSAMLELKELETATRLMTDPGKVLDKDLDRAIADPEFFYSGDIEVQLDGCTRLVHSALICQRCPFFEGLFFGRAHGGWLFRRREELGESSEPIKVDLDHIQPAIFDIVLRYLYADVEEDIFEDVVVADLDAFLDLILDVTAVANELMLDRLAQICQKMLGGFVTTRNVCQLLNAVAPCSVTDFKSAALEYLCLNLESMLENGLLDELDEDLMIELDATVQANQCALMPIPRSKYVELDLLERYPELAAQLDRARQTLIDSVALRSRLREAQARAERLARNSANNTARSPQLLARAPSSEFLFDMDEDGHNTPPLGKSPLSPGTSNRRPSSNLDSTPSKTQLSNEDQGYSITPEFSRTMVHGSIPDSSPMTETLTPHKVLDLSTQPTSPSSVPWGNAPLNTPKLDMKQIMAQTPEVRRSGISAAIAGSPHLPKVSQKERKRQRQLQQQALSEQLASMPPEAAGSSKQSPWQVVPTGPKVLLSELSQSEQPSPSPSTTPTTSRSFTSPPLTLRQTVSGKIPTVHKDSLNSTTPRAIPPVKRSVSQPAPASPSSKQPTKPTITTPIKPHSFRHNFPQSSAEPSLQLSMGDILAQQQQEKFLLKEAIAKRSLAEIQEEQAFQDWWDKEEAATKARMQEEEEEAKGAAAAATARSSKEQKSRSSHRRDTKRGGSRSTKTPSSASSATIEKQNIDIAATTEGTVTTSTPRTPENTRSSRSDGSRSHASGSSSGRASSSRRGRRGGHAASTQS